MTLKSKNYFEQHTDSFMAWLFKNTKEGILIFIVIGFYIHFTSVIIPLYKCIKAEHLDKRYENEVTKIYYIYYYVTL